MRFVRDTAVLVGGSAAAQAITVALTPVITRLFSPEAFGEFSLVMALAGPFVAVAALRYHEAIMLPDTEPEATALFHLSTALVVLMSLLLALLVLVAGDTLAQLVNIRGDSNFLYAVPVLVFLMSMRRVLDAGLQRARAFRRIAVATISVALVDRLVSITLGSLGFLSAWGLAAGRIAGFVSSVAWMAGSGVHVAGLRRDLIRMVARRYAGFARYSWSGLIQQLDRVLPVIMVGSVFGVATAGLFALARRVLIEPALLVGEGLSKTFYQRASELHRKDRPIADITLELVKYLFRWIIPPMLVFACVAGPAFAIVFGAQWRDAGAYSVLLMPWFISGIIMQPLARLFNVLEKQRQWAVFTVWKLAGTIVVLVIGTVVHSPETVFVLLSVLVVTLSTLRGRWILDQIGVARNAIWPELLRCLLQGLALALPVLLLRYGSGVAEWIQVLVAALLCGVYLARLLWTDPRFNKRLRRPAAT